MNDVVLNFAPKITVNNSISLWGTVTMNNYPIRAPSINFKESFPPHEQTPLIFYWWSKYRTIIDKQGEWCPCLIMAMGQDMHRWPLNMFKAKPVRLTRIIFWVYTCSRVGLFKGQIYMKVFSMLTIDKPGEWCPRLMMATGQDKISYRMAPEHGVKQNL